MAQYGGGPTPARIGSRISRGALKACLSAVVTALLATIGVAVTPAPAVAAAIRPVVEVITVPALPGVKFLFDGASYVSDEQGIVRLELKRSSRRHTLSIADKKVNHGDGNYTFTRWWYQGHHDQDFLTELKGLQVHRNLRIYAAFRGTFIVNYSFVDPAKVRVPRDRVTRIEFHGNHGQTVTGNGSGKLRVVGVRPTIIDGTLVAKEVRYSVQKVEVDGSNVVQVNQQVFVPSQNSTVVVSLLLRTAHFSTRDFLFGNPVGTDLRLTYPDGRISTVPLDADGKATLESLARGRYSVAVVGPGYSFDRPVLLSRNQYIDLPVLTYLDLWVIGGVGALLLVGLYALRIRTGRGVVKAPE